MLDLEQPAPELDSVPATTEAGDLQPQDLDAEGLQQEPQQPDPDEIEEEFEGLKLRGKKDLLEEFKKGRMLHADYTRKTQELAEERRTLANEREQSQRTQQLHQQVENDKFQLWSAHQRLQQLQQANLAALRQTNPELAESLRDELVQLSASVPHMGQQLNAKLAQLEQSRSQDEAKLDRQLAEFVQREFKNWTPEKDIQMENFVRKEGLDPNAVRQVLRQNPQALRILDKAAKYDQLLAQRFQKKPAAEPPKPATRIGGGAAANTKPLGEVTDPREWAERRRQRKATNR
jgi:hypothetical protein